MIIIGRIKYRYTRAVCAHPEPVLRIHRERINRPYAVHMGHHFEACSVKSVKPSVGPHPQGSVGSLSHIIGTSSHQPVLAVVNLHNVVSVGRRADIYLCQHPPQRQRSHNTRHYHSGNSVELYLSAKHFFELGCPLFSDNKAHKPYSVKQYRMRQKHIRKRNAYSRTYTG